DANAYCFACMLGDTRLGPGLSVQQQVEHAHGKHIGIGDSGKQHKNPVETAMILKPIVYPVHPGDSSMPPDQPDNFNYGSRALPDQDKHRKRRRSPISSPGLPSVRWHPIAPFAGAASLLLASARQATPRSGFAHRPASPASPRI